MGAVSKPAETVACIRRQRLPREPGVADLLGRSAPEIRSQCRDVRHFLCRGLAVGPADFVAGSKFLRRAVSLEKRRRSAIQDEAGKSGPAAGLPGPDCTLPERLEGAGSHRRRQADVQKRHEFPGDSSEFEGISMMLSDTQKATIASELAAAGIPPDLVKWLTKLKLLF